MKSIKNVVCAMSGGIDSAVSALILKRKGFNVQGVFMKNWDLANETGCTSETDKEDAAFVCDLLKIPFREVNYVKEYWNEVFSEMMHEYECGLTPNPDVLCNKNIKFGHFFDYSLNTLGADAVATGHYARNSWGQFLENAGQDQGARLLRAVDQWKDQTLFLSQIPQKSLQKTMFPVGDLTKDVVKKIALSSGFQKILEKKESTGMCFIGKREFQEFIEEYIEPKPGNFVDLETGKIVGHHKGIHYWTIGQRTHIGGLDKAYFVASIYKDTNNIMVVKGTNHPALFTQFVLGGHPHWIYEMPKELTDQGQMSCQFRYQHIKPLVKCTVKMNEHRQLDIHIDIPLRSMATGQYAVLYKDEECLGSAKILKTGPSLYELDVRDPVENFEKFR